MREGGWVNLRRRLGIFLEIVAVAVDEYCPCDSMSFDFTAGAPAPRGSAASRACLLVRACFLLRAGFRRADVQQLAGWIAAGLVHGLCGAWLASLAEGPLPTRIGLVTAVAWEGTLLPQPEQPLLIAAPPQEPEPEPEPLLENAEPVPVEVPDPLAEPRREPEPVALVRPQLDAHVPMPTAREPAPQPQEPAREARPVPHPSETSVKLTRRPTQPPAPVNSQASEMQEAIQGAEPLARPIFKPPAYYPPAARAAGWQGLVLMELTILASGEVQSARLVRGSGHDLLDETALAWGRRWRFATAPRDWSVRLPYRFDPN